MIPGIVFAALLYLYVWSFQGGVVQYPEEAVLRDPVAVLQGRLERGELRLNRS